MKSRRKIERAEDSFWKVPTEPIFSETEFPDDDDDTSEEKRIVKREKKNDLL